MERRREPQMEQNRPTEARTGQGKESTFSVRLTKDEHAHLNAAAEAAGYASASQWARVVLLDAAARSRSMP